MARLRTDKENEALRLYKQVVKIETTKATKTYMFRCYNGCYNGEVERELIMHLCMVNGERYVLFSHLPREVKNYISMARKGGIIGDDNFLHGMCGKVVKNFLKLEVILSMLEKLREYLMAKECQEKDAFLNIICSFVNGEIVAAENSYKEKELIESEKAFAKRVNLLSEQKEEYESLYRSQEREIMEREREEKEERVRQDRLRYLVSEIEAMGWEVSLKIKG